MRFFNSGVEIAHDGSPVSGVLATSSSAVGNDMAQLASASDPDLIASGVDVIGAKEPAGGRGLPRFCKGAMAGDGPAAVTAAVTAGVTPARLWEGAPSQGMRDEDLFRCTS